jgi:hypothetical protein
MLPVVNIVFLCLMEQMHLKIALLALNVGQGQMKLLL